ncbi:uncharacterized protein VTP21DRAFT_8690 [Calcarisporiella thermophila]|uniref:uncharacterized protein n=1 Tax=Calcarisporiella thermophila TaxID=911321 RepID=UPI00374208AC
MTYPLPSLESLPKSQATLTSQPLSRERRPRLPAIQPHRAKVNEEPPAPAVGSYKEYLGFSNLFCAVAYVVGRIQNREGLQITNVRIAVGRMLGLHGQS